MASFFFVFRVALAWFVPAVIFVSIFASIAPRAPRFLFPLILFATLVVAIVRAFSHMRRVRLIAERLDSAALGNRHRRQIELPFSAEEAFSMVDATVRELPYVENVESARDSLQVRARVRRMSPYLHGAKGPRPMAGPAGARRNLVYATVAPGDNASTLTLICEPEGGAALDWFMVDDGTNLENIQAIARAISRRVSEKRKGEAVQVRETATEKELTVAKLSLLHAQVEPHFLYNTLASAQVLTRSDPAKADQMLGYLIDYLRRSLPRAEDSLSTVGDELQRAQAYLEILKIRMGERLAVQVQVPEIFKTVPMPPMMLQTLVENAIKHGLEPVVGGGNIWILAREVDGKVAVTVADDGRGFSDQGGGTGIGLKNVRERLRLAYGDAASFAIVANFPKGVAATITLPLFHPSMKAIVAEDETLLRNDLVSLLNETWPELEIVAACDDGASALDSIETHQPDIAFLDIRMPGLTGLEVAAAAAQASPATQVVFVTAYDQYAIDAFDRGAVDYLLKPVSRERLAATVKRVRARLDAGGADAGALASIIDQLRAKLPSAAKGPPLAWITANVGKETRLILVDDVAYFRADNKYTVVMTSQGEALVRTPIRELLDVLDPGVFKQIHRSTIVNMKAVAGVTRDESGRGTLRLKNSNETLPVSLSYMTLFKSM